MRVILISAVVLSYGMTLLSCNRDPSYIRWEYIVPDDYQGYLAVRFDCPGGEPLIKNGVARVRFKPDGTFCTSDSYRPMWSSQWLPELTKRPHRSSSGKPIDQLPEPVQSGYAICCTMITTYGNAQFLIMWVGEMEHRTTNPYLPDDQAAFLRQRFNLSDRADNPR